MADNATGGGFAPGVKVAGDLVGIAGEGQLLLLQLFQSIYFTVDILLQALAGGDQPLFESAQTNVLNFKTEGFVDPVPLEAMFVI